MKVVNIKGTNGSGKTTIARQLLSLSKNPRRILRSDGKVGHIVMDDIGILLIGDYVDGRATGGCDSLSSEDGASKGYQYVLDYVHTLVSEMYDDVRYADYVIVFEGIILSTMKSAVYDMFMELEAEYGIEPYFVVLKADYVKCGERIAERNKAKSVAAPSALKSLDGVKSKNSSILYHTGKFYDPKYVRYIDVEKTPLQCMAQQFLSLTGCI